MPDPAPSQSSPDLRAPTGGRRLGRGTWDLRVERLFFVVGTAVMFAVGLVVMATEEASFGVESGIALLGLSVVGGWGLARWLGGRHHPERQVGCVATLLLLFFILAPMLGWLVSHLAPTAFALGTTERLMFVPAVIALVMIVSGRLALHLTVSQLAAFFIVAALFSSDDSGDFPRERVSTATTAQLAASADDGGEVLVRGIDHDEGAGVRGIRPAGAKDCQSLKFADERRTLMGLKGRRLDIRFDACWSADGRPVSLGVINHQEKGGERGEVRAVRLASESAFDVVRGGLGRPQTDTDDGVGGGLLYRDSKSKSMFAIGDSAGPSPGGSLDVRDDQGRVRRDGDPQNDTVVARVTERGQAIEVSVAFESADLFVRRPEVSAFGTDWLPTRVAGARPERGYALDIVTASLYRYGGSSASLTRITSRGADVGF